ncbi:MAG: FG-GAP-like repeat-containing protein [Verrucomicrobiales bacterium]
MLAGCSKPAEKAGAEPAGTTVPVLHPLPDFTFTAEDGEAFGLADLRGKVWVADFVFTRCASTCPMQTAELATMQELLKSGNDADDFRLVTFTVDPEHDTPEVLAAYAARYGADPERWKFLTASRGEVWSLSANGFKLAVAEDAKNAGMPILHSSSFVLVDRGGRVRGIYDGLDADGRAKLMADFGRVAAEPEPTSAPVSYERFPYPRDILSPPWLAARGQLQIAGAGSIGAFHGFRFTDEVERSGIDFRNVVVDDAGKYYKGVHYDHGNGLAVADVDGDGLPDLYFTTQLGSNQLWRNLGDGTFANITTPAIALAERISVTASFADTDNDGDPDLFVTTVRGGNAFFENDGRGKFTDITEAAGLGYVGHSSGGVFFDYDRDGLLDLFLCNVGVYTTDERGAAGYCVGLDDAFRGHLKPNERNERSTLYRNTGESRFADVSAEVGLEDYSWTGDAAPIDYNEDGWTDLYVLSMQGHDEFYENAAGKKFVKRSREVFPKTPWGAMGIQVFDFDNDGRQDIFITDMHSDMSEEIEPNREKLKSAMKWEESMLQSGGQSLFGNAFFRALGGGKFEEISDRIGAENYWPWGLSSGDLNADGFIDVFVTASMNYPFRYGVNSLLLNEGGKRFADAEFVLGVEPRRDGRTARPWFTLDPDGADKGHKLVLKEKITRPVEVWGSLGSRSSAIFDLENDGDLDIVTNEFHDGPMVLRSNLSEKQAIRWLVVRLAGGKKSNRDGLGAAVTVTAGGKRYTRIHDGVTGYLSHGLIPLYFGLGEADAVEKVEVRWPSGAELSVEGVPINQTVTIAEE